ncbi:DASH complex subunit ask1 [Entomortierella beljakovae]|nr:DASH complex subunit ask1 [Entomortierella beljakovae]
MASSPRSTAEVLDEIERLEQSITRTLQEIDQSFSDCQIIVSSKILPQIDRFSETSQGVWNNARLWLNFFEAASTTITPTVGRRVQAAKEAKERHQAAFSQSTSSPPHTPGRDNLRDSTNRRRKDSLTSLRLLADSPLSSMPSTPTPIRKGRKISQYLGDVVPPARIEWEEMQNIDNNIPTTPTRPSNKKSGTSVTDGGSTTPMITAHDRPLSMSMYSLSEPPRTPSANRQRSRQSIGTPRKGQDTGFVELSVEEDYREVISPPKTLQFSVPESKLATTPRSVIAKSRIDKLVVKDGLVIPQPIFVNDDDEVDAAITENYIGESSKDTGIGGSKKRSREENFQEADLNDRNSRTKNWASLTEQQRNKERLLKSPRKMASVQDFFSAPPQPPVFLSKSSSNASESQEDEGENHGQSPSRDLISQIEAQTDTTTEIDPLIAALATPPETRRAIMDSKARASLVPPLRATLSNTSSSSSSSFLSKVSSSIFSMPEFVRSNSSASASNPTSTAAPTTSAPLTAAPTSTSVENPVTKSSGSAIGSAFLDSFNSAFAATSNRRQTMASTVFRNTLFPSNSQVNTRNSIGTGYRATLTSTPFGGSGSGGFSATRRPEPLSAGRTAASAIVVAATTTSSIPTTAVPSSQPENLSTPVTSVLNTRLNLSTISSDESRGPESGSSRGFSTPYANRVPPPAPKLGYLSDTIMTQSSLGLNHDGFGGFESEDRTRMTMDSNASSHGNVVNGSVINSQDSDGMSSRPFTSSEILESGRSESSGGLGDQSNEYTGFGDEEDVEEDDNDATEHIMKSPCPPGKSFQGSNTDLRSVADNNKNGGLFFR